MNNQLSLKEFLMKEATLNRVSFHMPGHKGGTIFNEMGYGELLENLPAMDVTEIPGGDNLFKPETVIRDVMDRYRDLYESRESFLSVGGSSAGIIAAILSLVDRDDPVIMARNSHKSVYSGVQLAGGRAIYVYPEIIQEFNISGEIGPDTVEKAFKDAVDKGLGVPKVVILPSPNYYGIKSPIEEIAEIVHDNGSVLIVDQAHGAHLKFWGEGYSAEDHGGDVVINSIHKTLASFTQTAVINICSDRVDVNALGDKLQMIESSSPSYILMLSLMINAEILENYGEELIARWKENVDYFYKEAEVIQGLKVLNNPMHDKSKLVFSMEDRGYYGNDLEKYLYEKGITAELSDANSVMAMTGIGNVKEDYEKLIEVLNNAADKKAGQGISNKISLSYGDEFQNAEGDKTLQEIKDRYSYAIGKTSLRNIVPYPPGIPIIVEGEIITEGMIEELAEIMTRESKVIGLDEKGKIPV